MLPTPAACTTPPNCTDDPHRSSDAAYYLTYLPRCLRGDARPTSWAAAHVALDYLGAVVEVLDGLRRRAATEVAGLLDRDPAAHVALDDPDAVATLLYGLNGLHCPEAA